MFYRFSRFYCPYSARRDNFRMHIKLIWQLQARSARKIYGFHLSPVAEREPYFIAQFWHLMGEYVSCSCIQNKIDENERERSWGKSFAPVMATLVARAHALILFRTQFPSANKYFFNHFLRVSLFFIRAARPTTRCAHRSRLQHTLIGCTRWKWHVIYFKLSHTHRKISHGTWTWTTTTTHSIARALARSSKIIRQWNKSRGACASRSIHPSIRPSIRTNGRTYRARICIYTITVLRKNIIYSSNSAEIVGRGK